jgi:HemY protein
MKRLLPALLLALIVTLAGAGLAALYGQAQGLLGLDEETALAVTAVLVAVITAGLLAVIAALVQAPAKAAHLRGDVRRRARYEALSRGFMALGGGDPANARRWAEAAERSDPGGTIHPLSRLLAAWAAEADGDLEAAAAAYEPLLEHPDAQLAARRGLMLIARRSGDEASAQGQAEAVYATPSAPAWAWRALFDVQLRRQDRGAALALVNEGARRGLLSAGAGERLRAVVRGMQDGRVDVRAIDQILADDRPH